MEGTLADGAGEEVSASSLAGGRLAAAWANPCCPTFPQRPLYFPFLLPLDAEDRVGTLLAPLLSVTVSNDVCVG